MIDLSDAPEAIKRLARIQAGCILDAAFRSERTGVKDSATDDINDHQITKNASLTLLNEQAKVLMEGAAGESLRDRVTTVKSRVYQLNGVDGVR